MVSYRNPGPLEFDAVIERADVSGSSAFVRFPWSVPDLFGVKGRVPVAARFDGVDYRGSLVTYGGPSHLLLVLTEIRERLGKQPGDSVHVSLVLDTEERRVELAADTRAGLAESGQAEAFARMSYSHQREFHLWIEEAKRPDTRVRRIRKMTEMVAEGKRAR